MLGEEDGLQAAEDEVGGSGLMHVLSLQWVGNETESRCRRFPAAANGINGNLFDIGVEGKRGEEDIELVHKVVEINVESLT